MLSKVLAGLAAAVVSATLAVPAYAADASPLVAGAPQELSAPVGGEFELTLSVTNTGSTAIDGGGVYLATTAGFEATEQFSNCTYLSGQPRTCSFDQTLEPGKSYRMVLPYRIRPDVYAPGGVDGQFRWMTKAEFATVGDGVGSPGTGATLPVQEGAELGTSTSGSWQVAEVAVTGENGADLAAVGATVSGTVGDVVNAVVGVHENGPATLDWTMSGTSPGLVVVTIPAGTSLVTVPSRCSLATADDRTQPDGVQYVCETANLFPAGSTTTWPFALKIDKIVAGATGSVEVNPACQCQRFSKDLDKSNDRAPLVVNASPAVPDETAPVIEDAGLVPDQLVPAVYTFHPTVRDNVGVTEVAGYLNGTIPVSCDVAAAICRLLTVAVPNDTDATVTLRAFDAAGNVSAASTTRVHVDNVQPTGILSPAAGSSVGSGPVTVTVTGVSADTAKIVMSDGTTRTEAPWTFSWPAAAGAVAPSFVLTDRAGNRTTRASGYVVDDAAPVITRVDFDGSYSTNRLDTSAGWVGAVSYLRPTITDQSPVTRTEWRVNGVLKSSQSTFFFDARSVTTPTATVEVRAWDAVGNTAAKSFRVNIDKAAPAMTVYPAERALIRGTTFVTSIRATDRNGVAYTTLQAPVHPAGPVTSVRLAAGKDGARTLTWLGIDKLGNYAYAKRTVIVDNTLPALKLTKAPKNGAKLTKTATFTVTASDRNGIARVQLLVNGKVVATDTKAGYLVTLNPKKYGKKFTVQLRTYDKAGNVRYTTKRTYHR